MGPRAGAGRADGQFFQLSVLSKIVFSLDMLLGRLEIFPMLMLMMPAVWKKMEKKHAPKGRVFTCVNT